MKLLKTNSTSSTCQTMRSAERVWAQLASPQLHFLESSRSPLFSIPQMSLKHGDLPFFLDGCRLPLSLRSLNSVKTTLNLSLLKRDMLLFFSETTMKLRPQTTKRHSRKPQNPLKETYSSPTLTWKKVCKHVSRTI